MRRIVLLLGVLAALAAACASEADDNPLERAEGSTTCSGADLDGEALLDCVGPSLAFVETLSSTGSGVLLDDGYVVTNAHVVNPYPNADLTFPDGATHVEVPVVGIDAFADIAVLGPIDADGIDSLSLASGADVARGADVYLLGYPGEADSEPDPTISRGVLSRTRQVAEFGQTYLQTDASIGGGQSGGALVDGAGRLVGISGLSFAEEFALALDGHDVQAAVERILEGEGDEYTSLPPPDGGSTQHAFDLADEFDEHPLVFAAEDEDRTVELRVEPADGLAVAVLTVDFEPLLVNQAAVDVATAAGEITVQDLEDLDLEVAVPTAPGTYEVEVPADVEAIVQVSPTSPSPVHAVVHTSEPTVEIPVSARRAVAIGEPVDATFDFFETYDVYTVDLDEGDEIEVAVQSPQGDVAVEIRAPGASLAELELIDDGGGGLFDTDAVDTYTAPVDGTYTFAVKAYDGVVTGYRFRVSKV